MGVTDAAAMGERSVGGAKHRDVERDAHGVWDRPSLVRGHGEKGGAGSR